ncbi:N-acetylornithine carbamoyltransferase [Dolichospermum sp. ST_sed1]|nr:N-acetylornithine carbamoyltransferase [Dolichospermum sp. ST_sed1]
MLKQTNLKHFIAKPNSSEVQNLLNLAALAKKNPLQNRNLGLGKSIALIFFNPSLRTRMSMQKAAANLGLNCMMLNVGQDSWGLETEEGIIMNGASGEHIKEGARVIAEYCDLIAVRSFPNLTNQMEDYKEKILNLFMELTNRPIINMESAKVHPLQSLTDRFTIDEFRQGRKAKVVLTWAPHIKSLPQAVPNSFVEWMRDADVEFVITHPKGYELSTEFTEGCKIINDQELALQNADFVYTKNWSSFNSYGQILPSDFKDWMITPEKMALTNNAKFMHCLPVRRNVVVADEVLDSKNSIVIEQASNRVWSAQAVLTQLLVNIGCDNGNY